MLGQYIYISVANQQLILVQDNKILMTCAISTALNGVGEQRSSGCTPRGLHYIRAKIGGGKPINSVFVARRHTGEYYDDALASRCPERDWILTRILWLSGLEVGRNRLAAVDTMSRYIYIHGTPDSEPMGVPKSHGCVRMRNKQLIELFDQVDVGIKVLIEE